MGEIMLWKSEWPISEQQEYMEKRQLFLRSYHFSRKQSRTQRVRGFGVRVKRFVWVRLRSAKRLPRLLWHRLRLWYFRRRFHRLVKPYRRPMICSGDCSW